MAIEGLLLARFGEIDADLVAVVPKLMSLESKDYTKLLVNIDRAVLLSLDWQLD